MLFIVFFPYSKFYQKEGNILIYSFNAPKIMPEIVSYGITQAIFSGFFNLILEIVGIKNLIAAGFILLVITFYFWKRGRKRKE